MEPNPSADTKLILCVEDDEDTRDLLVVLIGTCGHQAVIASVSEALEQAALGGFALYILDNWMGQSTGIDLCERIRDSDQHTPIIFYSGAGYENDIKRGLDAGAQAYVVKPDFEHLQRAIDRLIL